MTQKGIQVIYNTEVVKAETQSDDTCLLYTMDGRSVAVNSVLWCVEVSQLIVCIHQRCIRDYYMLFTCSYVSVLSMGCCY